MDSETAKSFVLEKLKQLWLLLTTFASYILQVFDEKFPPETRNEKIHEWLKASVPWLITGSAVLLLSCCCYRCCYKGRRGGGGRMMKAPGQNFRIARNVFEKSPRSYFRGLRSGNTSQLLG